MKISLGLDPDLIANMQGTIDAYISSTYDAEVPNFRYLGNDDEIEKFISSENYFIFGFDKPALRMSYALTYGLKGCSLVSPTALISSMGLIGEGSTVADFVYVGWATRIGSFVKLNVRSSVHHDCVVGSYSVIGPSSTICGAVEIGQAVFVGAGATILPGIKIGDGAIIGAGAVVISDVAARTKVVGVPARSIEFGKINIEDNS
jgi:sugar O-acyltransferase (sialic acid O-acetyltransferase NeuD family)